MLNFFFSVGYSFDPLNSSGDEETGGEKTAFLKVIKKISLNKHHGYF